MKIDILRECVDLAETLNFTQTAKNHFITQPVLSKHVASLENEVGFQLFSRDKHAVCLTDKGALFVEEAHKVIQHYDDFLKRVLEIKNSSSDVLRVGYLLGASKLFMRDACACFEEANPVVGLHFFALENSEMLEAFAGDRIDVAISTSTVEYPIDEYKTDFLYEDRFCAVVLKGHPLAEKEFVRPDDFIGLNVVMPSNSSAPIEGKRIRNLFGSVADRVNCDDSLFDMNSIPMVLSRSDCAVVTMYHLRHYFSDPELQFVPFSDEEPGVDVILVWKRARESSFISSFCNCVKEAVSMNIEAINS